MEWVFFGAPVPAPVELTINGVPTMLAWCAAVMTPLAVALRQLLIRNARRPRSRQSLVVEAGGGLERDLAA